MDSATISLVISAAALVVSILSWVTGQHSKRAARAVAIEQVRGEITVKLLEFEVIMRRVLLKYQNLADRGYADLPEMQSRIGNVAAFLTRIAQQKVKMRPGISTGSPRQHLKITELKNIMMEYEGLFKELKAEAKTIEGVIDEFEDSRDAHEGGEPA